MKKTLFTLLLLAAMHFCTYAQKADWSTYTNTEGKYSVSFPGKPTETVQYDSSTGTVLAIHLTMLEMGADGIYMSSWTDLSQTAAIEKEVKQMLEDSRDGTVRAIQGSEVKTTALVLTGEPYIEFTFNGPNNSFVGKDRIYFINKVQYALISLSTEATFNKADADKFLRSFKHL